MSFKDFLIHVDDSPGCAERIARTATLAAAHDARLTGLYIPPSMQISVLAQSFAGPELTDSLARAAAEASERAKALFFSQAAPAGVPIDWIEQDGEPAQEIIAQARYNNLVTLGSHESGAHGGRSLYTQIIVESGAPVLILPEPISQPTIGQRVLIAWNASREAIRAVNGALPILQKAAAVEILIVTVKLPEDSAKGEPGRQLRDYLARRGVTASIKLMVFEDIYGVSGTILARSDGFAADLVVMGGFGRSRVRETMIGSTTTMVITKSQVPLLIVH